MARAHPTVTRLALDELVIRDLPPLLPGTKEETVNA
jgi:hypothetical protein